LPAGLTEITPSLAPIRREDFGRAQARRLLWRAGFGGSPAQEAALAAMGPEDAVDSLLAPTATFFPSDSAERFDSRIMREPSDEERMRLRRARQAQNEDAIAAYRMRIEEMQQRDRRQIREMQGWWLTRMAESPTGFDEKMTLFWHGLLASSYRKVQNSGYMLVQNELFRAHAGGNFGALLNEIIRDPAMLRYLDNDRSTKRAPNENLARELMELFSLGEGVYSESDIRDGARALTGHSIGEDGFVFREQVHDDGPKTILGMRGRLDGAGFVRAILAQRACAVYITRRLYGYYVRDVPDDILNAPHSVRSAIIGLTDTLERSGYDTGPMLRRLFLSRHFYEACAGGRIKSPAEVVVGDVRSLLATPRNVGLGARAMSQMGQTLFFPPSVAGWPSGRAWISTSTLLARQNFTAALLTGGRRRTGYDPMPLLTELGVMRGDSVEVMCTALAQQVLGEYGDAAAHPTATQRISSAVEAARSGDGDRDRAVRALVVLTSAPERQLC
jgi:uncharacterized protein (DUF1800 family)